MTTLTATKGTRLLTSVSRPATLTSERTPDLLNAGKGIAPTTATWAWEAEATFEGGDFSEFDSVFGSSTLAVTGSAAMSGSYGMEADLSSGKGYGRWSLTQDAQIQATIETKLDVNSITFSATLSAIEMIDSLGVTARMRIAQDSSADYSASLLVGFNSGSTTTLASTFTDAEHTFQVRWARAATTAVADGWAELRIDGTVASSISGLQNWSRRIEEIQIGNPAGTTSAGTVFFDNARWTKSITSGAAIVTAPRVPQSLTAVS